MIEFNQDDKDKHNNNRANEAQPVDKNTGTR
jgi:hypothetical protein